MKKYLITNKYFILTILIALTGAISIPLGVHAEETIISRFALSGINNLVAGLANIALTASAAFVSMTGTFLSISMNITTHTKDIFDQISGIKSVWLTIRDLSSMFIIFSLLYYSIMTILGMGGDLKKLIVNIVLAGVFINFSLFFVKVGVDASNLVSLQFYNAISPNTAQNFSVRGVFNNGGISNIFMQSLKLPTIYKNSSALKGVDVFMGLSVAMIAGVVIMITAGLSFLAAAIAFTARTAIIFFVMALSPLFFAGMIFPQIKKEVSDKLWVLLKGQLLFMPAYLFLMYIALKIISDDKFTSIFNPSVGTTADPSSFGPVLIGTIVQYVIAMIFINAPLVMAISLGGKGMSWAPGASGYNAVNSWLGGKVAGFGKDISSLAGRSTIGWGASKIDKWAEGTSFGNNRIGRSLRSATVGNIASAKFGGSLSRKDDEKLDKEIAKKKREIDSVKELKLAVDANNTQKIKDALKKMSPNEIANLDKDTLTKSALIPHLSSDVHKNIEKGDKSDADKVAIFNARVEALNDSITQNQPLMTKAIMKNMTGSDLERLLSDLPSGASINNEFIDNLKPGQLKDMENLEDGILKQIGRKIYARRAAPGVAAHPAWDHIDKNKSLWT